MKIADKTVVQMHYTLTSDEGKVIDTSEGREPLQYPDLSAGRHLHALQRNGHHHLRQFHAA